MPAVGGVLRSPTPLSVSAETPKALGGSDEPSGSPEPSTIGRVGCDDRFEAVRKAAHPARGGHDVNGFRERLAGAFDAAAAERDQRSCFQCVRQARWHRQALADEPPNFLPLTPSPVAVDQETARPRLPAGIALPFPCREGLAGASIVAAASPRSTATFASVIHVPMSTASGGLGACRRSPRRTLSRSLSGPRGTAAAIRSASTGLRAATAQSNAARRLNRSRAASAMAASCRGVRSHRHPKHGF